MAKQTHSNGKTTVVAVRDAAPSLPLAPTLDPEIANAFMAGSDVVIPAGAEQVVFTPSYTVPIGAVVQGTYGGARVESATDQRTGEVKEFESFLFKNFNNTGLDVWLRGGWNFAQLLKLANTKLDERITMRRLADKQHPKDPVLRISQFEYFRG